MEKVAELMQARGNRSVAAALQLLERTVKNEPVSASDPDAIAVLADFKIFLKSQNAKIIQLSLHCLSQLIAAIGRKTSAHIPNLVPSVIDRLGDTKRPVRKEAEAVLCSFMKASESSKEVLSHFITPLVNCKSSLVRGGLLRVVIKAADKYPLDHRVVEDILHPAVEMLSDGNSEIREAASSCVSRMYARVGGPLRDMLNNMDIVGKNRIILKDIIASTRPPSGSGRKTPKRSHHNRSKTFSMRPQASARHYAGASVGSFAMSSDRVSEAKAKILGEAIEVEENRSVPTPPGATSVSVYTEKELNEEMGKIISTLSDVKNNDWNKRIKSLNRLAGLVMGGAHDMDSFPSNLLKLKGPMIEQLQDLRSSVVKQACLVLAYISSVVRDGMEPLMEFVIPVLAHLNCVTIQVISKSANTCMHTLLSHTKCSRRAVQKIFGMGAAKAPAVREKSLQYLTILLKPGPTDMSKKMSMVEQILKSRLQDASAPVRVAARRCYAALASRWPSRAEYIVADLDDKTKRLLEDATRKFSGVEAQPKPVRRFASTGNLHSSMSSKPKRGNGLRINLPRRAPIAEPSESTSNQKPDFNTWPRNGKPTPSGGHKKEGKKEATSPQIPFNKASRDSKGHIRSSTAPSHARRHGSDFTVAEKKSPRSKRVFGAAKRVQRTAKSLSDKEIASPRKESALGGGASRISRHEQVAAEREIEASQKISKAPRTTNSTTNQTPKNKLGSKKSSSIGTSSRHFDFKMPEKPAQILLKKATTSPGRSAALASKSTSERLRNVPEKDHVKRWVEYASQANDWAEKVRCFNGLADALSNAQGQQLQTRFAGELVKLFETRLSDPHQKVAVTTLSCLIPLARCLAGDILVPFLDRLLVRLLPRVYDNRPAIRKAGQEALNAIIDEVGAAIILPMVRVARSRSPQARSAAMDVLATILIPSYEAFFANQPNLKVVAVAATRCLRQARPGANPLKKPAIQLLTVLYKAHPAIFVAHVNGTPDKDKSIVIQALAKSAPNLEYQLRSGKTSVDKEKSTTGLAEKASPRRKREATVRSDAKAKIKAEKVTNQAGSERWATPRVKTEDACAPAEHSSSEALSGYSENERMDQSSLADIVQAEAKKSVMPRTYGGVTVDAVLKRLKGNDTNNKLEAVDMLAWLTRQKGSIWEGEQFDDIFLGLLEELECPDGGVVAVILTVINQVLTSPKFQSKFRDYVHLELLVLSLLECLRDDSRPLQPVLRLVEGAVAILSRTCAPVKTFSIFVSVIETEINTEDAGKKPTSSQRGVMIIRLSLKALASLMERMGSQAMLNKLDRMAPPLVKCLNHSTILVRKSVVQCFVAMHAVAGAEALAHLSTLTESQQRLIRIYVEKTTKAKGQPTKRKNERAPLSSKTTNGAVR
mmetsp:Transcript_3178/g.7408  ORF Transcript_3178/g.7408 Transcript_3178/m.7408 type:complete len:1390 (+) Transcript_3178:45-4214(+)